MTYTADDDFERYLEETEYIDISNQVLKDKALEITNSLKRDIDKAIKLFEFVRDEIAFGFTSYFYNMKASDVLMARVGYSITKSTLLIALLRSVSIPARQIFVDISSDIYLGLGLDFMGHHCDHSYVEVFLENKWIKLDSFIIDSKFFNGIQMLKERDNDDDYKKELKYKYGISPSGKSTWAGFSDSFVQYVIEDMIGENATKLWGEYRDVGSFYNQVIDANNRYDVFFPLTLIHAAFIWIPNWRISSIRNSLS